MTRTVLCLAAAVFWLGSVAALAAEPTSADYMQFFAHQVGTWECELDNGTKGLLQVERAPNGQCLIGCLTMDGEPVTQVLEGYDPVGKCWKSVAWYAGGGHGVATATLDRAILQAGPVGQTYELNWTRHSPEGEQSTTKIVSKWLDKDTTVSESDVFRAVLRRKSPAPAPDTTDRASSIEGTITVDGQPAASARIVLHLPDGQFIGTSSNQHGRYRITIPCPAAQYRVTVEGPGVAKRYSSLEATGLVVKTVKGKNTLDLELTSQ